MMHPVINPCNPCNPCNPWLRRHSLRGGACMYVTKHALRWGVCLYAYVCMYLRMYIIYKRQVERACKIICY